MQGGIVKHVSAELEIYTAYVLMAVHEQYGSVFDTFTSAVWYKHLDPQVTAIFMCVCCQESGKERERERKRRKDR